MHDLACWRDRFSAPMLKLGTLLSLTMLTGCAAVGPDFVAPAAPDIPGYTAQAMPKSTKATNGIKQGEAQSLKQASFNQGDWWKAFNSPELNKLIEQGMAASPTLAAAEAKLEQARQTYVAQSGSTELPQVNGKLSGQKQKTNNSGFGQEGSGHVFGLYNAGVTVSYNLDLFGANRRALEALAAQTDYQKYQLDAKNIISNQEEQLKLIRSRFDLGAATQSDVLTLQTQLDQTRATLPPLILKRDQSNHLLATLVGQPPSTAMPVFSLNDFTLPAELPVVVPSQWVASRPDIQASTALLHQASAQYGVAVSNLYPQINLSATLGSQGLTPASLFDANSIIWSLIAGLTQPIFNAGLESGAKAAKAALSAAAANYQQTVLNGLRNTADALRATTIDADTLNAQAAAEGSAQASLDLTQQQMKLGAVNAQQLLTAQQQVAQTRLLTLAARSQRLTDTVALFQAMGGGIPATTPNQPQTLSQNQTAKPEKNTP
ncbi:efflux transporter outer membrane subunit [Halothiobacillus sp. 15-55-196]|uniref:efflux transporter outer membrane subunit n=1 Tax=Halothiobacillus sp. 15-55-196 TaxID=1970382 RepID=UPI0025B9DFEE|nr:efflux transporter outer membrane subunit [Halothiobacillus sp. 15-55-196]